MARPALATPEELEAYLQRPVPLESASLALRLASGKVRSFIRRDIPELEDFTTCPDDIRAVVLSVAGRIVGNPADLRQEAVGGISVTYATETVGGQLTDSERSDLSRWRPAAYEIRLRGRC